MKFGTIIINHWASERNPHKIGIVVRDKKRTVECTNARGDFWELVKKDNKIQIVGELNLADYNAILAIHSSRPSREGAKEA